MSYSNTAAINVRNDFPFEVGSITITHKYSDDAEHSQTWQNVAPAAVTDPVFLAGYNTGFIHYGLDYWKIEVVFPGGISWKNDGWKECMMKSDDEQKKGTMTFSVGGAGFNINLRSGGCITSMSGSNNYNSFACVKMQNKFPIKANITLSHQYSDDKPQSYTWNDLDTQATSSDGFVVYFNTGILHPGLDYWNVSIVLDIPPYDNQGGTAFSAFSNAKKDKECVLYSSDVGKSMTFAVSPANFYITIPSGACTDDWKTPNGYNTMAFIEVRNDFDQMIRSLTLSHRYSDDTTYLMTRTMISATATSYPLVYVEYNTGFLHPGFDYWNITAILDDARIFQNKKKDKECYMTDTDAEKSPLTFKVSSDNFYIGLPSGPCNDGMEFKGQADFNLGRDNGKPYNQNAYLATHNSYANFDQGFYYAQQSESIEDQMAMGVTALMLDIWIKDGAIYLFHNYKSFPPWVLQPFASYIKLVDAMVQVKNFLDKQKDEVITLIFEDYVPADSRNLVRQVFVDLGMWDMCFLADQVNKGWNVATQGWPTINWLLQNGYRLIPFSSVPNPFPYQWTYMSESVYGNASTVPATWVNPRDESSPLDQKALCALNHFYTFSATFLSSWFSAVASLNTSTLLNSHVNDCNTQWKRYPNYLSVDFFELFQGAPAAATKLLNDKLHGTSSNFKLLHRFVVNETETQSLLNIPKGEQRFAELLDYIEEHLHSYLPLPKKLSENGNYDNAPAGNLSLVIYALKQNLSLAGKEKANFDSLVQKFNNYLLELDERTDWKALSDALVETDKLACLVPFALLKKISKTKFKGFESLVKSLKNNSSLSSMNLEELHADSLLGLGVSGLADTDARLSEHLSANAALLTNYSIDTVPSSLLYSLVHSVFYLNKFQTLNNAYEDLKPESLLSFAIFHLEKQNIDLAAELIVAYWLLGGETNADIFSVVSSLADQAGLRRLKEYQQAVSCNCQSHDQDLVAVGIDYKEKFHATLVSFLAIGISLKYVKH